MNRSLARAAPVRFLIAVTIAWTIGRGIALAGWQPDAVSAPSLAAPVSKASRPLVAQPAPALASYSTAPILPPAALTGGIGHPPLRPASRFGVDAPTGVIRHTAPAPRPPKDAPPIATPWLRLAAYAPDPVRDDLAAGSAIEGKALTAPSTAASRLSGSAWVFLRGGGRATALSSGGQIGGGQAGARILYTVDRADRLAVSARLSGTIGGLRQTEAAIGIDWTPVARLPVHLMLDRRIAIDEGGRNAWTLGTAGGAYDVRVAPHWRLDGYAEAGVVGAHRRDLYADGALRIARAIELGGGRSLAVGGGLWGAGQPGVARLDVGPSAVLRLPVAGHLVAVALDWRERIVGAARPGSGAALTIATDF